MVRRLLSACVLSVLVLAMTLPAAAQEPTVSELQAEIERLEARLAQLEGLQAAGDGALEIALVGDGPGVVGTIDVPAGVYMVSASSDDGDIYVRAVTLPDGDIAVTAEGTTAHLLTVSEDERWAVETLYCDASWTFTLDLVE